MYTTTISDFIAFIRQTQFPKVTVLLALALVGILLGVGLSMISTAARKAADDDYSRRLDLFSSFQSDVTNIITSAIALADTVAAFAGGDPEITFINQTVTPMTFPVVNFSSPPESRMRVYNDRSFRRMARKVMFKGITSLAIAPGCVVSQLYGATNTTAIGRDVAVDPRFQSVIPIIMRQDDIYTSGPTQMNGSNGYDITAWAPIFVNSTLSPTTFYGFAWVLMDVENLFDALNVTQLKTVHKLDYVFWFVDTDTDGTPTVVLSSDATMTDVVMTDGMQMYVDIAQVDRNAYFAFYPEGGPVTPAIKTSALLIVLFATIFVTAFVVALTYVAALCVFAYRHRRAPANGLPMYMAALTLRGAQPIVERAPLESVRMFTDFTLCVRRLAVVHGCYPICEIGDRTMYVVAKDPASLMRLAKEAVLEVDIRGTTVSAIVPSVFDGNGGEQQPVVIDGESSVSEGRLSVTSTRSHSHARTFSRSYSKNHSRAMRENQSRTRGTLKGANNDRDTAHSSFIGSVICRASASLHVINTAHSTFDAARDVYYYGNASQMSRLCTVLDATKGGEVAWTQPFADDRQGVALCKEIQDTAVASHVASVGGADTDSLIHVAALWKDTGDERDNEDPSVAMASLTDAYLKRMTAIVSEGRTAARKHRRDGNGDTAADGGRGEGAEKVSEVGSSEKSADATAVTRNVTLLHIAVLKTDGRMPLDVVRRIVVEEKGAVVSAHENYIIAAFNLLTPGGHHQIRAANAVMRLRAALTTVPFVCSIHHGKVTALIADGLVMCSGDVVSTGRKLLDLAVKAVADAEETAANQGSVVKSPTSLLKSPRFNDVFNPFPNATISDNAVNDSAAAATKYGDVVLEELDPNGLCFLFAQSEMSSSYDCEAVDMVTVGQKSKHVVFRLANRKIASTTKKGGNNKDDDEWMYQLRDEEDQSPYAAINGVFARLADNLRMEALRHWQTNVVAAQAVYYQGKRNSVSNAAAEESNASPDQTCPKVSIFARNAIVRHFVCGEGRPSQDIRGSISHVTPIVNVSPTTGAAGPRPSRPQLSAQPFRSSTVGQVYPTTTMPIGTRATTE